MSEDVFPPPPPFGLRWWPAWPDGDSEASTGSTTTAAVEERPSVQVLHIPVVDPLEPPPPVRLRLLPYSPVSLPISPYSIAEYVAWRSRRLAAELLGAGLVFYADMYEEAASYLEGEFGIPPPGMGHSA